MSFEIHSTYVDLWPPLGVGMICRCPRLEMYCCAREIDMTTLRLLRPPLLFICLDMIHTPGPVDPYLILKNQVVKIKFDKMNFYPELIV